MKKLDITLVTLISGVFTIMIGAPLMDAESRIDSKEELKEVCGNEGGKWKDGECKFKNEEDKEAYEDYVCDEPEDTKRWQGTVCGKITYNNNNDNND